MKVVGRRRSSGEMFAEYIDWRAEHPVRRPDDRAAERRVRGRDRHDAPADPRRDPHLRDRRRRRRQRDHDPPDRLGRQGAGRAPRPAARARRRPVAASRTRSRSCCASSRPAPHVGRYVPRDVEHYGADRARGQRRCCSSSASANRDDRRFPNGDRVRHPPQRSASTSPSVTASTSASAPRSPGSRAASRSTRCSKRFPEWERRLGRRQARADVDRARLGDAPGRHAVTRADRSARRRYDSPVRRQRAAETRERIVAAGAELLHGFPIWNWRALTVRAVAERAGVNERTVYRLLRQRARAARRGDAHARRRRPASSSTGSRLDDVADVTARILEYVSSFPLAAARTRRPDARRRATGASATRCSRAVGAATTGVVGGRPHARGGDARRVVERRVVRAARRRLGARPERRDHAASPGSSGSSRTPSAAGRRPRA